MKFYTVMNSSGKSTRWWMCIGGRDELTNFSFIPGNPYYFDPYHRWDHAAMGLEKVRKHGYYLVLSQNGFSKEWIAKLVNPDKPEKDVSAWDDIAPAAICLACIEANKE